MKKYWVILMFVVLMKPPFTEAQDAVPLSLKEAIKLSVENNLDVRAELYNPAMFEADVRRYGGIYDLILSAVLDYKDSTSLSTNTVVTGGLSTIEQRVLSYNAGISQLLPTGGTVGLSFNNDYTRQNFGSLRKYYDSDLTLNFTQPLLQNFGRDVTELNISVSRFNKEGSFDQFKTRLLNTVSQVIVQYSLLISARQDLEIRRTSLSLAERILKDTTARVNAGVLPAMEILNAEFGVATRQRDVIDAERAVLDQSDQLRLLIQLPGKGEITPVNALSNAPFSADEDAEISRALANRPDLKQLQTGLRLNELQSRVARHQTLPNLTLTGSFAPTGTGDSYRRDLERVASTDYPVWGVGLQFSYPLGNNGPENEYIRTKLKVEQTATQIRSLQESIAVDVKTAVRAINSTFSQLDVTRRGSAYAEQRLNAFIKKNQVGLATTKDVLDVENDLVTAKGNEVKALVAYNNAVTQLRKVTGELLSLNGINVSLNDADALYERSR